MTIGLFFTSVSLLQAQDETKNSGMKQDTSFCMSLKDGMPALFSSGGKEIFYDLFLSNGTKVSPDGNVTKKDGSQSVLKEGECISDSGNVVMSSAATKKEKPKTESKN